MSDLPFHVSAVDEPLLYRLPDGRFQIVRDGTLAPLLTGHGYILVTERLHALLESEGASLPAKPAVVYDPTSKIEVTGYRELRVLSEVMPETASVVTGQGGSVWAYANRYLFVSLELQRKLSRAFPGLVFSEGFSRFVGA